MGTTTDPGTRVWIPAPSSPAGKEIWTLIEAWGLLEDNLPEAARCNSVQENSGCIAVEAEGVKETHGPVVAELGGLDV
eukprot:8577487-Pyramimonas_sp.AAC.1